MNKMMCNNLVYIQFIKEGFIYIIKMQAIVWYLYVSMHAFLSLMNDIIGFLHCVWYIMILRRIIGKTKILYVDLANRLFHDRFVHYRRMV